MDREYYASLFCSKTKCAINPLWIRWRAFRVDAEIYKFMNKYSMNVLEQAYFSKHTADRKNNDIHYCKEWTELVELNHSMWSSTRIKNLWEKVAALAEKNKPLVMEKQKKLEEEQKEEDKHNISSPESIAKMSAEDSAETNRRFDSNAIVEIQRKKKAKKNIAERLSAKEPFKKK